MSTQFSLHYSQVMQQSGRKWDFEFPLVTAALTLPQAGPTAAVAIQEPGKGLSMRVPAVGNPSSAAVQLWLVLQLEEQSFRKNL